MNIIHINYLLTTAQIGSINKASQKLHLNQQQLSKIVLAMERELGCQIFTRSHRGITPTECGKDVLTTFAKMLNDYDQLLERLAQQQQQTTPKLKGTLALVTYVNIWNNSKTNRVLNQFSQDYPAVSLTITEQPASLIIETVAQNKDVVGLLILPQAQIDKKVLPDTVRFLPLRQLHLMVYAAKDSDFAKSHKSTSLKQLLNEPLIIYKPYSSSETPIEGVFMNIGPLNIKYSLSNLQSFHSLLQKGSAVYLGTQQESNYFERYNLAAIPIRDRLPIYSGLLLNIKSQDDPLINAFVDFYISHY